MSLLQREKVSGALAKRFISVYGNRARRMRCQPSTKSLYLVRIGINSMTPHPSIATVVNNRKANAAIATFSHRRRLCERSFVYRNINFLN